MLLKTETTPEVVKMHGTNQYYRVLSVFQPCHSENAIFDVLGKMMKTGTQEFSYHKTNILPQ